MPSSRSIRFCRALLVRVQALAVAIVLLAGVASAGARYFTCPMMGSSFSESSCCAGKRHTQHETPALEQAECCTSRTLGSLPPSPTAASPEICAVPLAAILPPFDVRVPRALGAAPIRYMRSARAGPPSATERRAELMVWTS